MKFLKFLRIFLIPIDVIVLLLGGAHFWGRFNPDNFFAQYFKKTEASYNLYTLVDKITGQGLYLLIAGGVILVLIIILFIVCAVSDKKYKNSSEYRIQCQGFEYEYDEDKLTVIAKYGYERNGYGPGIDEVFGALPEMFQCVFNEGYTRILHIQMKTRGKEYEGKRYFVFAQGDDSDLIHYSDNPLIRFKEYDKDDGEPFVVKKDIIKTRMVEKEYVVEKEGTIKLSNGKEIYRQKGSTFKDKAAEQYVAGQKDVWYQGYVHRLEYTFKESGKVVVAEDGTKLLFEEARKRQI